jgi:outer membrane protein OmpA-like peptidoglycan-associated protein
MAQFCTRCGKPLSPEGRFCAACGAAVANATSASPMQPASSPPPQQVPQFTPVIAAAPPDAVTSGASSATSSTSDAWTTVAAPEASPAQSTPFAPVDMSTTPAASPSSPNQGWADVAPVNIPTPAPSTNAPASEQQAAFSPASFSAAAAPPPPAPNQQWSQTTPHASSASQQWSQPAPTAPNQQWSQTPANAFPSSPPFSGAGQPRQRSVLPKLIGIALVLIFLVGVIVVGGVVYVGYKVQQKARAVTHDLSSLANDNDLKDLTKDAPTDAKGAFEKLKGLMGAISGKMASADGIPVLSPSDSVTPCSASSFPAQDSARIPFKPGTIFTTAWGVKYGDVEARNSIDSIDDSTVSTTSATQEYKDDNGRMSRELTISNRNCTTDYQSADSYITVNSTRMPRLMHDMTRYRLSDETFRAIKSSGRTNLNYVDIWNFGNGVKLNREGGMLTRVEPHDLKYPMIVNDQRVELPVIHLKGDFTVVGKDPRPANLRPTKSGGEIFVLDDPADPLVLNWRLKDPLFHNGNFRVEIVKINFPVAKPENVLEKQLTKEKRAVTYGIYFDFNRDTLKPESDPVLKEIAQAMTNNPDWKLTVEGNTDNIGGDNYNLDLSRRRAAAVKQALVSQYNIAADRLLTGGFGASHPVAPNDTLEGRARNRRVELVRQ